MPCRIGPVVREEVEAACRQLAAARPPADQLRAAERYEELLATGELDSDGLFAAHDSSGILRGVMLVQAMPGAIGLAWPPIVSLRRNRQEIENQLVVAACDWLRGQGTKVCQAFAGELECETATPLLRHGFHLVTRLIDYQCDLTEDVPRFSNGKWASDGKPRMHFERYSASNQEAFLQAMLATYRGSLDCPESTGARTEGELLDAIAAPNSSREHWFLARRQGESVGVLLLDLLPEARAIELTYLGLLEQFRGQGLGRELLRFAMNHGVEMGARSMALSVDSRNQPALQLYQTHDFQASGERCVFLAHWPTIS